MAYGDLEFNYFSRQWRFIDVQGVQRWLEEQLRGYYQEFYVFEDTINLDIHGFSILYDYHIYDSNCKVYIFFKMMLKVRL